jgi:hypothetical protein
MTRELCSVLYTLALRIQSDIFLKRMTMIHGLTLFFQITIRFQTLHACDKHLRELKRCFGVFGSNMEFIIGFHPARKFFGRRRMEFTLKSYLYILPRAWLCISWLSSLYSTSGLLERCACMGLWSDSKFVNVDKRSANNIYFYNHCTFLVESRPHACTLMCWLRFRQKNIEKLKIYKT